MDIRQPLNPLGLMSTPQLLKKGILILVKIIDVLKIWHYPMETEGDFKSMKFIDKAYWLFKSIKPMMTPEKGSQLDLFFQQNRNTMTADLPKGFKRKKKVSCSAVGDLMTMDGLENSTDIIYEKVSDILFDTDISFANLESQLTSHHRKKMIIDKNKSVMINLSLKEFQAIKGHKDKQFSVMNLANNHTFDMGWEGMSTTMEQLEKTGIEFFGVNQKKEEQVQATIYNQGSLKIGLIGATFSLNGRELPKGKEYIVNHVEFNRLGDEVDLSLIKNQISYCQQNQCDFIIGSFHWGLEHDFFPKSRQVSLAHSIIEMGIDMIIGHHSHVIQPVEFYQTKRDPDRIAVICYSLGNITTPMSAPYLTLSEIINFSLIKGCLSGQDKTYLNEIRVYPVVCLETYHNNLPTIQVEKLSDLVSRKEGSEQTDYLNKVSEYADLILGDNWRNT